MEFRKVMQQWKRMCNTFFIGKDWACDKTCPMYVYEFCHRPEAKYPVPIEFNHIETEGIEKIIMGWAAEHPEIVYPTWGAYLHSLHNIPSSRELSQPIPADIAQKLGLQPKEG